MAKKRVETIEDALAAPTLDIDAAVAEAMASESPQPALETAPAAVEPSPESTPELAPPAPELEGPTPPKLSLRLDEPEPEAELESEPDWLSTQSEDVQHYIRELRQARDGQRHAYARRKEQVDTLQRRVEQAELERRQAIAVALEGRKAASTSAAPVPGAPAKPGAAKPRIPVQVDPDTGEMTVDPDALAPLVDARAKVIVGEQVSQQTAASTREATVERLVAEHGISQETQTALFSAFQDTQRLLHEAAQLEGGGPIQSIAQAKALLRRYQAEGILQRKYPGITVDDVYDIVQGSSDPDGYGHNLVRVAKAYQERWFGAQPSPNGQMAPAKPATPPRAPRPIGDHPASMASRASGANSRTGRDRSTLDEIISVGSVDQALHMTPKEMDELVRRWESEIGEKPSGFLT